MWSPGEHLVIDWGVLGGLHVFCAVLAWSRVRFVRFADNERADTTLALLAECFEHLGGVPGVVLADRMGCLKGGVVANMVVPTGEYVRFAAHYGFRPDFCEAADPESKGIVENLVGYAKTDLMIPGADGSGDPFTDLGGGEHRGRGVVRRGQRRGAREICAVPAERLVIERELLAPLPSLRASIGRLGDPQGRPAVVRPVRLGPLLGAGPVHRRSRSACTSRPTGRCRSSPAPVRARWSPSTCWSRPGEASIHDDHYGGPRPAPRRAVRPKTAAEKAFCALGPTAEAFITGAAAAGNTRLGPELAELNTLAAAHGEQAFLDALARAVAFGRWRAADVRSILAAGAGTPQPTTAGDALVLELPPRPDPPAVRLRPSASPDRRRGREPS